MKISVMIKPVSNTCNLNCKYCFYNSLVKTRQVENYGKMSIETLENIIKSACEYANGDEIYFSVQGGEPLLAGLDFFLEIERLFNKYKNDSSIVFAVQTNATLIDEKWCEYFKRNNCLIGVSLDGDKKANQYRIDKNKENSFDDIMNAITLLKKYGIEYNILTVITKYVAKNIDNIYDFLKNNGFKYLQFTPCLYPYSKKERFDSNMYMTGEEYGQFLINLTRHYFQDYMKGEYVSIRQLDSFVHLVGGDHAYQCGMNGVCSLQYVVEANGNVYPCDFYCLDEWLLGNINEESFKDLATCKREKKFLADSLDIKEECKRCEYWALCKNGCKRERRDIDKCTAYKMYFNKMLPYLKRIAGIEQ